MQWRGRGRMQSMGTRRVLSGMDGSRCRLAMVGLEGGRNGLGGYESMSDWPCFPLCPDAYPSHGGLDGGGEDQGRICLTCSVVLCVDAYRSVTVKTERAKIEAEARAAQEAARRKAEQQAVELRKKREEEREAERRRLLEVSSGQTP